MKPKVYIFIFLTALLFAACHSHVEEASQQEVRMSVSPDAFTVTQDECLDFSVLDTATYYIGKVKNISCFFRIDSTTDFGIAGTYYKMDSSGWCGAETFQIRYDVNHYVFCSGKNETKLKFEITIDTNSLFGSFHTNFFKTDLSHFAFKKYREPSFPIYTSTLNILSENPVELSIEKKENVVYGKADGYWVSNPEFEDNYLKIILKSILKTFKRKKLDLKMDLYLPKDSISVRPLIVFIHGGAFYIGDKEAETMKTWCTHFAKLGYVTASINYRMGFKLNKTSIQQCGYEAIQDARAALRYLVANAEKYRIDTSNIFLGGTSAGSIIALGTAFWTTSNMPKFISTNDFVQQLGGLDEVCNEHRNKFRIKALANMWGAVYDLDELNGHPIPVISFHGTADAIVPSNEGIPFSTIGEKLFDKMYGSEAIHRRLNTLNIRNEFYPLADAGHAPYQDKKGKPNDTYFFIQKHMTDFFKKELLQAGEILHDKQGNSSYIFSRNDIRKIHWKAEGGLITRTEGNTVEVYWMKDAPSHTLSASGMLNNGSVFYATNPFREKQARTFPKKTEGDVVEQSSEVMPSQKEVPSGRIILTQ